MLPATCNQRKEDSGYMPLTRVTKRIPNSHELVLLTVSSCIDALLNHKMHEVDPDPLPLDEESRFQTKDMCLWRTAWIIFVPGNCIDTGLAHSKGQRNSYSGE